MPEPEARGVGVRGRACDSQHSSVKVTNYRLPGVQVIPESDSALNVHLFAQRALSTYLSDGREGSLPLSACAWGVGEGWEADF